MKITVEGESYELDLDRITAAEARIVKTKTRRKGFPGMGVLDVLLGLRHGDPDAIVAIVYLAMKRGGVAIKWEDLDSLNVMKVDVEDDDADEEPAQANDSDEDEDEYDPDDLDPTQDDGTTQSDE